MDGRNVKEPEVVVVGSEEIEVWPENCNKEAKNCIQCYLEGKVQCGLQPRGVPLSVKNGAVLARKQRV